MTKTDTTTETIKHLDFAIPCVVHIYHQPCPTPAEYHCTLKCRTHGPDSQSLCGNHLTDLIAGKITCDKDNFRVQLITAIPL